MVSVNTIVAASKTIFQITVFFFFLNYKLGTSLDDKFKKKKKLKIIIIVKFIFYHF